MRFLSAFALLLTLNVGWAGNLAAEPTSLYDLHEKLVNQDNVPVGLDVHRGNMVLVTMFYGSCKATCPLIIDTLRAVERKLDASQRTDLRVLMISFDPDR